METECSTGNWLLSFCCVCDEGNGQRWGRGRCLDVQAAGNTEKQRNGYSVSEWAGEENSESLSRESVRNLICLFLGLGRNRRKSSLRIITMSWLVHDLGFEFFTYKIQEPWTVKLSRGASDGSISPIRSK